MIKIKLEKIIRPKISTHLMFLNKKPVFLSILHKKREAHNYITFVYNHNIKLIFKNYF